VLLLVLGTGLGSALLLRLAGLLLNRLWCFGGLVRHTLLGDCTSVIRWLKDKEEFSAK
jgi:hypothetical protein